MSDTTAPYARRPSPAPVPAGLASRRGSARGPLPRGGSLGRRRMLGPALLAVVALLLVAGRVLHDSRSALRAGDAALARGDRVVATREYQHAVRMYLPGSPFVSRALSRLEEVATAAAAGGDATTERHAWEAMRAGLLGARSFYTPHLSRLEVANGRLALLYAQAEEPAVDPGASTEQRRRWHADRLAEVPGPATAPTLAALLGLGLWLGAVVVFIRRGVDRGLRLDRRWAVVSGVCFFAGFALFLVGLRFA